jgi:hypothetical protein
MVRPLSQIKAALSRVGVGMQFGASPRCDHGNSSHKSIVPATSRTGTQNYKTQCSRSSVASFERTLRMALSSPPPSPPPRGSQGPPSHAALVRRVAQNAALFFHNKACGSLALCPCHCSACVALRRCSCLARRALSLPHWRQGHRAMAPCSSTTPRLLPNLRRALRLRWK